MICASCGLPISGPSHDTENIGADDRIRCVCDQCWHNPALWFLPRELEKHGTYPAVVEAAYHKHLGIPDGQMTFGTVVPDDVRRRLGI